MNRQRQRRLLIVIAITLMTTCFLVILAFLTAGLNRNLASDFLNDLLRGHDEAAFNYLSSDLKNFVQVECPDGTVSGCLKNVIDPAWGELKTIFFAVGSERDHTELFHAFWNNHLDPVSIVIMTGMENDKEVIVGWRGFVISEGEAEDSKLLHGIRHDNEFPLSS